MQFFEHFLFISDAMSYASGADQHNTLWNEDDGFYYDAIQWNSGYFQQLPIRSMVGLMPLYATLVLEPSVIKRFPGFKKRMEWFIENRPDISQKNVASLRGQYSYSQGNMPDEQSADEGTVSCLLLHQRRGSSGSWSGCWMRLSSCPSTVFDRE